MALRFLRINKQTRMDGSPSPSDVGPYIHAIAAKSQAAKLLLAYPLIVPVDDKGTRLCISDDNVPEEEREYAYVAPISNMTAAVYLGVLIEAAREEAGYNEYQAYRLFLRLLSIIEQLENATSNGEPTEKLVNEWADLMKEYFRETANLDKSRKVVEI